LEVLHAVTPAKAGVQNMLNMLDSGFRRNDKSIRNPTFYEAVNYDRLVKRKKKDDRR
jgi:hypothetical protein